MTAFANEMSESKMNKEGKKFLCNEREKKMHTMQSNSESILLKAAIESTKNRHFSASKSFTTFDTITHSMSFREY